MLFSNMGFSHQHLNPKEKGLRCFIDLHITKLACRAEQPQKLRHQAAQQTLHITQIFTLPKV